MQNVESVNSSASDYEYVLRVIAALRVKAIDAKWAHLSVVADQLKRDKAVNFNRAMRLAMRLNRKLDLGVNRNAKV